LQHFRTPWYVRPGCLERPSWARLYGRFGVALAYSLADVGASLDVSLAEIGPLQIGLRDVTGLRFGTRSAASTPVRREPLSLPVIANGGPHRFFPAGSDARKESTGTRLGHPTI
jgi:hypothetical protein